MTISSTVFQKVNREPNSIQQEQFIGYKINEKLINELKKN